MKSKIITVYLILVLTSCATTGSGSAGLSLIEAIEQSAEKIAAELPAGSRVAIVAFESPNDGLSGFIMEELTGSLIEYKIEVADRQNLEYINNELEFQMSGNVSDESAQSIGKFLGAQLVISGELTDVGGTYRFRASAINVETAIRASVPRFNVRNDRSMQNMVASLANPKAGTKTAKYGVSEKTTPQTAGTFLDRGILFAMRKEYDLAIADFTDAIQKNPNMVGAYILRGRASVASVALIKDVEEDFSGIVYARTFKFSGDPERDKRKQQALEQAIQDFTEAIRLDPNNAVAYKERGVALAISFEDERAIEDYNRAIRLNPNFASAYSNRGYSYSGMKDHDKAIADYTQAVQIDPNYKYAYMNRAYVYNVEKKDIDRAIADYSHAIRIDPNYVDAYISRARLYYSKGSTNESDADIDCAIDDYTQVIRIDSNNHEAFRSRGLIYGNRALLSSRRDPARAIADYDRAIADYTQAIRIEPSAYLYGRRGEMHHGKKDFSRAIADYEAALHIDAKASGVQSLLDRAREGK